LVTRLGHAVVLCRPGDALTAGIRSLVAGGAQRLVVLPLDLPAEPAAQTVQEAVRQASRWPFLTFHAAPPLTWHEWAACVHASALDAQATIGTRPEETAVLLAGRGSPEPLANADLALLAHLVREAGGFARVEYAFLDRSCPSVPDATTVLARLGSR